MAKTAGTCFVLYINYISFYYGANHYLTKTCAACLTYRLWEELLTRGALCIVGPCLTPSFLCNVARLYSLLFLLWVFNTLAWFCFLPSVSSVSGALQPLPAS